MFKTLVWMVLHPVCTVRQRRVLQCDLRAWRWLLLVPALLMTGYLVLKRLLAQEHIFGMSILIWISVGWLTFYCGWLLDALLLKLAGAIVLRQPVPFRVCKQICLPYLLIGLSALITGNILLATVRVDGGLVWMALNRIWWIWAAVFAALNIRELYSANKAETAVLAVMLVGIPRALDFGWRMLFL